MGLFKANETSNVKHNMVKNPNCYEVNQLAIFQALLRIWTWDYQEQIQQAVRVWLKLRISRSQVQYFNCSAKPLPLLTN